MTADPRLLLPLAELPGLDPVGLNVYLAGCNSCFGIFIDYRDSEECGVVECADDGVGVFPLADVHLDLSDPATRDRCLRWLAGRVGIDTRGRCPWWREDAWGDGWWVGFDPDGTYHSFGDGREHHVPALADLDPTDDTRLPDGSRLVDALALAAVLATKENSHG